ncbi:MAG: hypothetical protein MR787_05440 [Bacteroidales bacterium]|nr:hypothetical protein [Bacteroidales bacterium]
MLGKGTLFFWHMQMIARFYTKTAAFSQCSLVHPTSGEEGARETKFWGKREKVIVLSDYFQKMVWDLHMSVKSSNFVGGICILH